MMNRRDVFCENRRRASACCARAGDERKGVERRRRTMRCELESCGFWLYRLFRISLDACGA